MRYSLYVLYCLWLSWAHLHISIVPAVFWTETDCLPYSLNRCPHIWKHSLCFIKRWRKRKTVQRPHTRKSPLSSSFLIHKMCKKCMHCHFFIWCKPPLLLLCCRIKMKAIYLLFQYCSNSASSASHSCFFSLQLQRVSTRHSTLTCSSSSIPKVVASNQRTFNCVFSF